MIFYGNSTTARLEARARKLGLNYHIVISPDNADGRIFAVGDDDGPWARWTSLGWTKQQALESLESRPDVDAELAEDYYAELDGDWTQR